MTSSFKLEIPMDYEISVIVSAINWSSTSTFDEPFTQNRLMFSSYTVTPVTIDRHLQFEWPVLSHSGYVCHVAILSCM